MTRVDRLTAEMLRTKTRIRQADLRTLERLWRLHGGLTSAQERRFVAEAQRVHGASLAAQAAMYAAYARALSLAKGLPTPATVAAADIIGATRAGAPLTDRMERAVVAARTAIADGRDYTTAMRYGLDRLTSVAGTDHQLVHTHAAQAAWGGQPQMRYQRVLVGTVNCGLCIAATSKTYKSSTLMPIHPGCDCGVAAIPESQAPRDAGSYDALVDTLRTDGVRVLDRSTLSNIRVSDTQLDQIRRGVQVHQHGELGPTLVYSHHKTSGPPTPWRRKSRREFDDTGALARGRDVPDGSLSPLVEL